MGWDGLRLAGYQNSASVHWGNGAADQRQHDVYGEVLDCADGAANGGDVETVVFEEPVAHSPGESAGGSRRPARRA